MYVCIIYIYIYIYIHICIHAHVYKEDRACAAAPGRAEDISRSRATR